MPSVTRDQFLQAASVAIEKVAMPEFGDDAYINVYGMTAKERSQFESQFSNAKTGKQNARKLQEVRERLCVHCCRDDNGVPLFTHEDVEALGKQAAAIIERIVDVAMRICGMKTSDIEDLAGN